MSQRYQINEYAQALYDLISETNQFELYLNQLNEVIKAFNENPDFWDIFVGSVIDVQIKKDIVINVFGAQIEPYILNFLLYLVDKKLEFNAIRILEKVISFMDNKMNKMYVKIYTPFELNAEAVEKLNQKLKKLTHFDPISTIIIDPNLIGGIRVEYDSNILDYSIETKIKNIKYSIKGDY